MQVLLIVNFKVTTLKLPVDEGLIAIGGTMDLDGQADLQVALKDVDIVPFLPLMGKDIQATGWVTGVVNITGETKNPKVELSGAVESGSFNGVGIDEVLYWLQCKIKLFRFNEFKVPKVGIS